MEAKEAVRIAKGYVAELFREDGVHDLLLEEIDHDIPSGIWIVTVGFSRQPPRDTLRPDIEMSASSAALAALLRVKPLQRIYKVVRVREDDGTVLSVKRPDRIDDAA